MIKLLCKICVILPIMFNPASLLADSQAYVKGGRGLPSYEIIAPDYVFELERWPMQLRRLFIGGNQFPVDHLQLQVYVYGEEEALVPSMRYYSMNQEDNSITFQTFYSVGVGQHIITVYPTHLEYHFKLVSNVAETLMIEPRLQAFVNSANELMFWDGDYTGARKISEFVSEHSVNSISIEGDFEMGVSPHQGLGKGLFPAVGFFTDQAALGFGLKPNHLASYYGSSLSKETAGWTASYVSRYILQPECEIEVEYVIFPTDSRWGKRALIEKYYQTEPSVFDRDPSLYPKAYGLFSMAHVKKVVEQGDLFIETARRRRVGALHFWGTAPCGDVEEGSFSIRPRGIFYTDDEPAVMYYGSHLNAYLVPGQSRDDLAVISQQQLEEAFQTANIAALPVNYIIPVKGDRDLAVEKFRDGVVRNKEQKMRLWLRHDHLIWTAMNPGANSFGRSVYADLIGRINRYSPAGFYFDNGAVNWRDYGSGVLHPAFDNEGNIYGNVGMSIAVLLDQLKSTNPGVHLQPGEFMQYSSVFRADSYLVNNIFKFPEYPKNGRFLLGKKPMFFAHPCSFPDETDATVGRRPYVRHPIPILQAFRWGALPWLTDTHTSVRSDAKALGEVFADMAMAGWEPVSYATTDNDSIWVERFQRGVSSLLYSVVNPTDSRQHVTLRITGCVHPDSRIPLLVDYTGSIPIRNRVSGKEGFLEVDLHLKPHSAVVLQGIAWIVPPSEPIELSAIWAEKNANERKAVLSIERGVVYDLTIQLNRILGSADSWDPASVVFTDEEAITLNRRRRTARISAENQGEVHLLWNSRLPYYSDLSQDEISFLQYPRKFAVLINENCNASRNLARRIKGFAEYQASLQKEKCTVSIRSYSTSAINGKKVYIVSTTSEFDMDRVILNKNISIPHELDAFLYEVDESTIFIKGDSERSIMRMINKYLDMIEEPIPYEGNRLDQIMIQGQHSGI